MSHIYSAPTPEPEQARRVRAEDSGDWRTVAPRWVLLAVIMVTFGIVGALSAMVVSEKSEREKRVEDAVKDTPTKYQSRLAERQAVSEVKIETGAKNLALTDAKVAALEANYLRLSIAFERSTEATKLLTVQVARLNEIMAGAGVAKR